MSGGIVARPAEMRLTERAMDYLAAGPADVVALIGHICQLPNPPRIVAEHMATALFAGRPEFARDDHGSWRLDDAGSRFGAGGPVATATPVPGQAPSAGAHRRNDTLPPATRVAESHRGYHSVDRAATRAHPYPERIHGAPASGRHGAEDLTTCDTADLLASLSYVVVDVETTGTRAWTGDRITEIAAVVVRNGEVQDVFETLVNPQRSIPPYISALTNITWAMVKDAPVFRDVCERLIGVMEGHVFVAHNAAFDWRFVTAEVSRASGHRLAGRQLCTVRLARKLLPHLRSRSLDHVAYHYGVTIGARHRAGGDALATAHVLLRLLRDARDRGCESWPALEALVAKRKGRGRRGRRSAMPRSMDRDAGA